MKIFFKMWNFETKSRKSWKNADFGPPGAIFAIFAKFPIFGDFSGFFVPARGIFPGIFPRARGPPDPPGPALLINVYFGKTPVHTFFSFSPFLLVRKSTARHAPFGSILGRFFSIFRHFWRFFSDFLTFFRDFVRNYFFIKIIARLARDILISSIC